MKNEFQVVWRESGVDFVKVWLVHKSQRLFASIDYADLDKIRAFPGSWVVKWNPTARTFYARANDYGSKGRKRKGVYMHRFLLGVTDPKKQVDHDNHDGLDNRRCNLKVVNRSGNGFNRLGAERGSKSGRRNVYWNEREQQWMVWLVCQGKRYYIGYFDDIDKADTAAKKLRLSLGGKA
jgi:hypothetical protein